MGLSAADFAAHKEQQKSTGPNPTKAEGSVANILGLSPEALAAYKQRREAAARAAAKLPPRQSLHARMQPGPYPPEILTLLRKFGVTADDLEKRKITLTDLVAHDEGGLTRDDIEWCLREGVNPMTLIRTREMIDKAPL